MEIQTPAIIFPAISMLMLAYTNRFMVISQRIRTLTEKYTKNSPSQVVLQQIANFRMRFELIRWMQAMGVVAFILCSSCILCILNGAQGAVKSLFGASIGFLILSLVFALWEIMISTHAINIELQDIEDKLDKV